MRFIDVTKLKVKAGKGGDGVVAFRRELYVAKGGPSGGDGGRGGNIIFVGDSGINTLLDLRKSQEIIAEAGVNGAPKDMHGRKGHNTYVKVPLGTLVRDIKTQNILGDIVEDKQEIIIAAGGVGGRGNARFASATNRVPKISEKGTLGQQFEIICELKLLANAGLVGLPNAGKSTLLGAISASKPTVADYPFTTLNPHLGVVKVNKNDNFVMADLPGLIAGASLGKGLGLQFLRHIERCQVLVHMIDISDETQDHFLNYELIMNELATYNKDLEKKPQIIIANKIDLPNSQTNLEKLQVQIKLPIFAISAMKRTNLEPLIQNIFDAVKKEQNYQDNREDINDEHIVYEYINKEETPEIIINLSATNRWNITGKTIEAIYQKNPLNTYQNILLFKIKLQDLGVYDELRKQGIEKDHHVVIYGYEFIWE
ncbi:GTPase ObgE [Spiroplasma endosymbiont of Virgichneumon dumeticola]|uniref:GTPase ObgE n=1 Tax=Spiroplasma endosymbiont of Virgichneumon dumeticola TaxID=3139323 RepID=UPI0035C9312B